MKWSPQPYLIKLNFLHYNSTLFIVEKGEPNSSNEIVAMTIYMTVIVMCLFTAGYHVTITHDTLMLKVSKVLRYIACGKYCTMNKGSNPMYVEGVESSSIYTIRAVMHVEGVKRTYTSLLITF